MQILHLSTFDIAGGAARAAYRLHTQLQAEQIESKMLVRIKYSDNASVYACQGTVGRGIHRIKQQLTQFGLRHYSPAVGGFSPQWFPDTITAQAAFRSADVINLHWVCNDYLHIETLARLQRPIVWTLHDMWAFTGGCHYSEGCDRYQQSCGACPQLHSHHDRDLSHSVWLRKHNAWQGVDLTIVTPSRWLAQCAAASSLFRHYPIEVIPYGLDLQQYRPIERAIARQALQLPLHKSLILFGATQATRDTRKGFHLLQAALADLHQRGWSDEIELVVFGADPPDSPLDLGFRVNYLGTLKDEELLAYAYSAADVFVCPSLEDNLPNTVMESLACGTPAVAFDIGGMPDMIEHHDNGYLAQPYDVADLAQGLAWVLTDRDRQNQLRTAARTTAEQKFSQHLQTHRYQTLYEKILTRCRNGLGG